MKFKFDISPRIRFAPNASGSLHLGNARTALVAYYYARSKGYEFHLRIDDDPYAGRTADERAQSLEIETQIIEDLKWIGIEWDKIYRLSQRSGLASWAIMNIKDENNIYPYSLLQDLDFIPKYLSYNFSIVVSFFDDVFTNTVEHIRGTDLCSLENLEKSLYKLAPNFEPFCYIPNYKYVPVLGTKLSPYHKTLNNAIYIKECREKKWDSELVKRFLFESFGESNLTNYCDLVASDVFWKKIENQKYTELNTQRFYQLMKDGSY